MPTYLALPMVWLLVDAPLSACSYPNTTILGLEQALGYLAELKSNRIIMWRELGLVISLNGLVDAVSPSEPPPSPSVCGCLMPCSDSLSPPPPSARSVR